ncbi:sensor histidine kinase [Flavobacterium crassostreae]|uniref:histidine kinase n=1 Tax=Flavobacterium crassostreae TaxID=1763534 RepID=A0A1B9E2B8_9FLAO|nr:HAMP domain-containing sensor histidine kinase [Flavobacterium crassostreae]OCB76091.1 two-component sensor histidine kinase [Flavobacterium crassostreae]
MQQLSFKNRIAFNYILTTALLIFGVFGVLYSLVRLTFYNDIDANIGIEVSNHLSEIKINARTYCLSHKEEWKEREHNTVDVNPVFITFMDPKGRVLEKSPNLKMDLLHLHTAVKDTQLFDTTLSGDKIRQVQVPILSEQGVKVGYIIVAMSLEGASVVLKKLAQVLLIAYPLILVLLFFIARFIAGRSIKPISAIIKTSNVITKDHLTARIALPQNKDELYTLSKTINQLLDRIEYAIAREKQFTSDASHELRTPLTVLKGTLEVLIRKTREPEEYHQKIRFCITEVDRLNDLVDQLLLLARFENQNKPLLSEKVSLNALFLDGIAHYSEDITQKNLQLQTNFTQDYYIYTDRDLFTILVSNLLSNAVKYSNPNGMLRISIHQQAGTTECHITDTGIGIASQDLDNVFHPFFRSHATAHPEVKGTGLGLSIVKKIALLLDISLAVTSKLNQGTTVILKLSTSELK